MHWSGSYALMYGTMSYLLLLFPFYGDTKEAAAHVWLMLEENTDRRGPRQHRRRAGPGPSSSLPSSSCLCRGQLCTICTILLIMYALVSENVKKALPFLEYLAGFVNTLPWWVLRWRWCCGGRALRRGTGELAWFALHVHTGFVLSKYEYLTSVFSVSRQSSALSKYI